MMDSIRNIPIVYYHSFGPKIANWNRNFLTTGDHILEEHLKYYKKNYTVISLNDYYNIRNGNLMPPKRPLVITIDDGFLDNWIWGFPLFKKYNVPATIFVSPEMVDTRDIVRPNAEDLLTKKFKKEELVMPGYMSWPELNLLEASGIISVQSHTMSHTKYFVSDKIVDFHHPGGDCLYPIGNMFKEQKPFHMANPEFEKLMPYGTPFFEERSSVIARKVNIDPGFNEACIACLDKCDFSNYSFNDARKKIEPVYDSFLKRGAIISSRESEQEYKVRLHYEICESKKILEAKLNKQIDFLCWPHGDNSAEAHEMAIENGYKATLIGKLTGIPDSPDRIGKRFGFGAYLGSTKLGFIKLNTKIKAAEGKSSATVIKNIYQSLKKMKK